MAHLKSKIHRFQIPLQSFTLFIFLYRTIYFFELMSQLWLYVCNPEVSLSTINEIMVLIRRIKKDTFV
ncbi:hypothetical protein BpHYR1_024143 [Brachionus plicatilis]|uniref:Uncharacterized protein n=1 Tax=Brachionus plicatilis TaxID=10195 RepID=A0A3M7TAB2_BRAPC|nr:hypothetical protein BpHYR1_024143 [Brachionus plicatilis]